MTPIEILLAKLPGAKKAGNGWSARCPAHDDGRASLSIAQGDDGKALVKCHAGCELSAILAAVGLKLADLFPPKVGPTPTRNGKAASGGRMFATAKDAVADLERRHGKRSAQWTYHDVQGEPVGVVVRWDGSKGKDIRPVARQGDGWRIGAMPEPRPQYGLPDLAAARRVVICEGEKAADAARSLGLIATTSVGGSQAAAKTDWRPLAAKEIWILPDNDAPGRKYADTVAGILANLKPAPLVRVVELANLPECGDIVDWIDAHGDAAEPDGMRAEIEALAQAVQPWQPADTADRCRESLNGEACTPSTDSYLEDQRGAWDDKPELEPRPIEAAPPADTFPDPPSAEAYLGLAGDLVRALEPHTEADPVAILVQTLIAFGSVIGRTAFFQVEGTRHYLNLFAVMVGTTSKGRKGTSWGRVRQLFATVEPTWEQNCVHHGLSSGEGLIWVVRDPIITHQLVKERGQAPSYQDVQTDPGVTDKRCLVQEPEFCSVLKQFDRQGNTLSAVIRQAWESGNIRTMTKNSPAKTTEAHISIVGHVTGEELRRYLSSTEAASGFGNRFLWLLVRRSKCLPDGGGNVDLEPIAKRFAEAVSFAREIACMRRDDEARELWHEIYPQLSGDRPGLAGSLLARAEAQTMRLACVYALLDRCYQVEARHIKAALALWDYCERSTRCIFGNSTGDPVADEIADALRHRPDGMSRTDISAIFSRNKPSDRIARALNVLAAAGLAVPRTDKTDGRTIEHWFFTRGTK